MVKVPNTCSAPLGVCVASPILVLPLAHGKIENDKVAEVGEFTVTRPGDKELSVINITVDPVAK